MNQKDDTARSEDGFDNKIIRFITLYSDSHIDVAHGAGNSAI